MEGTARIRQARLADAEVISHIINVYASSGLMLERATETVVENIRNFFVAEDAGEVVGCCAIAFYTRTLAEIRSLAVQESWRLKGTGRLLVEKAEAVLREEGVAEVFVLTLSRRFFARLGYSEIEKEYFPQKIWRDCTRCPKLMACDETAMVKKLPVPNNTQTGTLCRDCS